MGFWRKSKVEEKALGLTDPGLPALFGIVPTASGITVGPSSAMRVPAVRRAVSLIAESVATLPFKAYSAHKQAAKDHPAYGLVHDWANEWTSAEAFREALTADALLHGHGFAQVIRLSDGQPYELHRLEPGKVQALFEPDGTPFYLVGLERGQAWLAFHDVLHVSAFGGVSPITLAREAVALALQYESHVAQLFAKGGRPSGIIKSPKKLEAEGAKKLAASWFTSHSGRNAGGTAILDEGMTYESLSGTNTDALLCSDPWPSST